MMLARPIQLGAHGLTAGFGSLTHGLQNSPDGPELAFLAARLGPPHPIPHNLHPRPPVAVSYCANSTAALSDRIAPEDRESGVNK